MNKQEKNYFEALTKDRSEIADVLDRRAVRGYKDSVVEKYSDQAHFIYELLQNADDAGATRTRFVLEDKRLLFAHNGTRHFSVSDPKNEEEDSENKTLGDINAITSIANSNKTGASIGKFGVGFKAVFQYTSTPHIYDPEFRFKIERFIVPILLDSDFPGRKPDETLFVFPFDHPDRKSKEAYEDISDKLSSLSFPLLFLTNLKEIEFEFKSSIGIYGKKVKTKLSFGDTTAEEITLTQNNGENLYDENLWLFSRLDECDRRYSVGFFMDNEGHLKKMNEPAFCFFPTKEVTNLNFIFHAPFLLTDSREGIRAGVEHNDKLIKSLADLTADSLEYLRDIGIETNKRIIDDNIVTIIPIDRDKFTDPSDKRKISFLPFYNQIKVKFENSELLPTSTGYARTNNAYWAEYPQLPQLFSDEQLADIVENTEAKWVFVSFGHYELNRNNKPLSTYIESLTKSILNEDVIINGRSRGYYFNRVIGNYQSLENIKGITPEFIEKQPIKWLHRFYGWLYETKHRTEIIKEKPIFLDQNGNAVAAYDEKEQLILFLPVKDVDGYTIVNDALLKNKNTIKFIESLGVKQPSLRDQIYNKILPLYENGGAINPDPHFEMFFNYYCKCSKDELEDFIDLIKDYQFLVFYDNADGERYRDRASTMYLPTPELCAYFETKKDTRFIALDEYKELVGEDKEKQLISFLSDLGIKKTVSIYSREINPWTDYSRNLPHPHSTRGISWNEPVIDGCEEILDYIRDYHDDEKSSMLWNVLLGIIENNRWRSLESLLRGTVHYFYRTSQYNYFDSFDMDKLRTTPWIKDYEGDYVAPNELYREALSDIYDKDSKFAEELMDFLGIEEEPDDDIYEDANDDYLTDSQREKISLANKLKLCGIETEDDLEELLEIKRQRDALKNIVEREQSTSTTSDQVNNDYFKEYDDAFYDESEELDDEDDSDDSENSYRRGRKTMNKATRAVVNDIVNRTKNNPSILPEKEIYFDEDIDDDELLPSSVDYSKKIERAKEKSATEIDRITYFENLFNKSLKLTKEAKYSFSWFQTLLELESINSRETNSRSREVSISFAKVEREPGTKRTLILKHANRYIPQFMEDLADIPLVLHMEDQTKTVAIEVANIKSYTLRVKMKNAEDISGIDLSLVTNATIDAKSPAFLLEELRKKFNEFEFDSDFNMKDNLCENIEFVFGPPGTGKTTYLAQNVLLPLMRDNKECKVLVLTPTNKSADVLVNRIMELSPNNSYEDWLVRFGATGDEVIEQSPVFRDKTFDIRNMSKSVTVTTIARFPYDYFMPQGARIFLDGINWDYIIIDEASMIPIANIIYPLYKKTPKKFIIAGDPFQIEPITSIDIWKNENIYTMVELDSFVNPKTKPHQYKVQLLTTQYRSVPDIGTIFSNFTYGGVLKHYRKADSQSPLNVGNDLGVETLNIIKFPVKKYESIYRCKRLNHSSSYQIYSALFTFEYVCYLSRAIARNNPGKKFRIGIIAPYRAQSDMIDKLISSEKIPNEIEVQVGTIHGFQGDECDIIFAVFNTPPTISASKEMFLNKKNIINVSISRARDYLFIVMPDDDTENIENLRLVKRVENLIRNTDSWNEFMTSDLEEIMFDDSNYLENNAFSTSHQSVNVYGLPEKKYEIRAEDTAVDVQIHKNFVSSSSEKENEDCAGTFIDSYKLDENLIPEILREDAIDLPVTGALSGWYYLVPYQGKLKSYTDKPVIAMFTPQLRNGQEKRVSVSVCEDDRIIYISRNMFEVYEEGLSNPDGIEVQKTSFD